LKRAPPAKWRPYYEAEPRIFGPIEALEEQGLVTAPSRSRVAIIGAGHVGATAAYALMLRALFREIVLIDKDTSLAEAEAADLSDANALARPARIWSGTYADVAGARIAIITAGAATHGDEARLSVARRSSAIVAECVAETAQAGFRGVIIVAANPVDLMARVAFEHAGLPAMRVIGTGTLLDTSRLRQVLGRRLEIAPDAVDGFVIGEHGDSEVVSFSTLRIGGLSLDGFARSHGGADHEGTAVEVRDAAYKIIKGKGYTSFGVATAIVRICEAIIRDERAVLPVSAMLTGQFGISDLYLSLPCILGAEGVCKVLTPELCDTEMRGLRASAATLRSAYEALQQK
jgi:L-lactate dehydrogenase